MRRTSGASSLQFKPIIVGDIFMPVIIPSRLVLMRSIGFAVWGFVALVGLLLVSSSVAETNAFRTTPISGEFQQYLPLVTHYKPVRDSIFGVQLYGNTLPSNTYYNHLVDSGTTWIRIPVRWIDAEPERLTPKVYDWSAIDRALSAATPGPHQFRIIGTVYYAPVWAVPDPYHARAVLNDDALPDFAQFTAALAARYSGNTPGLPVVTHWEFYNEPDITTEPGGIPLWGDNGDKYAQMLAAVYPAVKAGNPNAQVLFGGIAYDAFVDQGGTFVREFLDDVLAAGGGNYFDIMNFHFYPGFSPQWTGQPWPASGPGLLAKATFIRNKLENEYGVYKPMVITESGWYSDSPPSAPSSPEIQARHVVKLYAQSMAADIDIMIWWMLHDAGIGYNDTGLVTNGAPIVRKLAFDVYQHMTEQMDTAVFVQQLPASATGNPAFEVYQFADSISNQTLYIAWLNVANYNNTQSQLLSLPALAITVKSIEGNLLQVVTDGDDGVLDGRVTIAVSNRPLYVEVNQ